MQMVSVATAATAVAVPVPLVVVRVLEPQVQVLELVLAKPIALEPKQQGLVLEVQIAMAAQLALLMQKMWQRVVLAAGHESNLQQALPHPLTKKGKREVMLVDRLEPHCL